MAIAEKLASQQKSISVAEFFEKNKHLLGFDSPTRGIITTIKEAIDNSLDACEEAEVLPDIWVSITKLTKETLRITVEDNGPGIVPDNVPYVFGKLLYGSRFHQIRQSRGQQGIGISAAVLFAQLTTGVPAHVISRTGADKPAYLFDLMIRTEKNEPEIIKKEEYDWDRTHGTRIELEFTGSLAAKRRLIDYLKYTAVVNPHARIQADIDGERHSFERVSEEIIVPPQAIAPHPYGIEFGTLKRMAATSTDNVHDFLVNGFSRVGQKSAEQMLAIAGIKGARKAKGLSSEQLKVLISAMQEVDVPPPPASLCLSPIGEGMIVQGLEKEFELDFVKARTRKAQVYSGHPFIIEAAIGYGGKLDQEGQALLLRFANRVPLLYQQGACAVTNAVAGINWRSYNISQQSLPLGPVLLLVHVASTNVPFTSESKDAVAAIPEMEKEITLVLQDLGRELKNFINKRDRNKLAEDRARAVCSIIPDIAEKVAEIVELPPPDISPIEGQIMRRVVAKKKTEDGIVGISVMNYTRNPIEVMVYSLSEDNPEEAVPKPDFIDTIGTEFNAVWRIAIEPESAWKATYPGKGRGSIDIRGVDEKMKVVVDLDGEY